MIVKVTAHIPNRHDATNFYRGTGPLGALSKKNYLPNVDFIPTLQSEYTYALAQLTDIGFFQRPSTSQELEAIRLMKRCGIPVIVDYDDLLFDVPTDNPAHRIYMNKNTQETIIAIMKEATAITVSTKELKRCIQIPKASLNDKVFVVPNALDDLHLAFGRRMAPPKEQNRTVLWRGSPTHERDVLEYAPEIGGIAEKHSDISFTFVGWNPWFLTERMRKKQAICSGALSVGEFMDFLYLTAPTWGMVPLHKSRFNLCKSNIGWIETTWAGGICLCPDWEEWRVPGAITYRNQTDFEKGLEAMIQMKPGDIKELNEMSWKHIKENLLLSQTTKIRAQVFGAALGLNEWPEGGKPIPEFYSPEGDPIEDGVMELE